MNKFFRLIIDTNISDYARPRKEFYRQSLGEVTLLEACSRRQIQYLSRQAEQIEIDDSGGLIFPDFMFYENILLVSEAAFDIFRQTYLLFEKPVTLTFDALGFRQRYHLLLPPKISTLKEVGNYRVFALGNNIIVDDELRGAVSRADLTNIHFVEVKEE